MNVYAYLWLGSGPKLVCSASYRLNLDVPFVCLDIASIPALGFTLVKGILWLLVYHIWNWNPIRMILYGNIYKVYHTLMMYVPDLCV